MKVLVAGDLNADLIFSGISSLRSRDARFWPTTSLFSWVVRLQFVRQDWHASVPR